MTASCWPICTLPQDFNIPFPQTVLSVVLDAPSGPIELHTAHVPNGSSYGWKKIETFEGIYSRLARVSGIPRILCGDFNTPQKELTDGTVITFGQYIMETGEVVVNRSMTGQSGSRWDMGERNVVQNLAKFDLPDVYRSIHGYANTDFSHYVQRNPGKGVRFDHVFASLSLKPETCEYLHEYREQGLSDHSPIEVCFNPGENN